MNATIPSSALMSCSASSAPSPAEGRVEIIVSGCAGFRRAPEHEVDRDQCCEDEQRCALAEIAKALALPANATWIPSGRRRSRRARSMCSMATPRHAPRQAEGDRHRRKLALVVHHQWRDPALELRHARQRHLCAAACPARRCAPGRSGRAGIARLDLEHDAVLIALGVDRRDLPLRKGVPERRLDVLHPHAEREAAARSIATSTCKPPGSRSARRRRCPAPASRCRPPSAPISAVHRDRHSTV